jgi:hypothetical protein
MMQPRAKCKDAIAERTLLKCIRNFRLDHFFAPSAPPAIDSMLYRLDIEAFRNVDDDAGAFFGPP